MKFLLARGPQPCTNPIEIAVIVSRVANKLPRSFGNTGSNLNKQADIQDSGDEYAKCSVCCAKAVPGDLPAEIRCEASQDDHLGETLREFQVNPDASEREAITGSEGVTNRGDSARLRRPQQGTQNRREDVNMLVTIKVRERHPSLLNALDLDCGFSFYLIWVDLPR